MLMLSSTVGALGAREEPWRNLLIRQRSSGSIRGARFRIRSQWALEGATTATIVAAAARARRRSSRCGPSWSRPTTGICLLVACGRDHRGRRAVIGDAASSMTRSVARRIDRASNLADRLSTAIAFERALRRARRRAIRRHVTHDLMHAAIRDGVRAAPRANIRAAAPFAMPKDSRAALGFLVGLGARRRPRDSDAPIARRSCSAPIPTTAAPAA